MLTKVVQLSYWLLLLNVLQTLARLDDDGTIVQTKLGLIRGHILKSENRINYWSFQEIPYAASPTGENRFQIPKTPDPWTGVLNTTRNTKICYQITSRFPSLEISEDCLYINVYTPVKPGTKKLLPVLTWIHGGGFTAESGVYEYYGPKYIMDHEVVVVTFNYRLGPFGFIGTDDGLIPSSLGMKDQLFALQWVNENIQMFGGNKEQVTIVGESAGSLSVGNHLVGPWENDIQLFHAAIMQSGSPVSQLIGELRTNATEVAIELAKALDPQFSPKDTLDLLNFLQQADAKAILETGINGLNVQQLGYGGQFQNFLDGNYKKVPVIIGFNSEEMLFFKFLINNTTLKEVDSNPTILISEAVNMSPRNRSLAGELLKKVYTINTSFVDYPGGFVRYVSDIFVTGTCKQVELASVHSPYYLYQFAYKGELGSLMAITPMEGTERVIHGEDLFYMWEGTDYNSDLTKFPKDDQLMSHRYVKMWTNFVKYLNPTPGDDSLLDDIKWLPSEPRSLRYLNINSTLEMRENPRQYHEIKPILETFSEPPYNSFN